jgi:hypothetical protein
MHVYSRLMNRYSGGFSASCPTGHLSGSVLTATCGNGAGGYVTTSLDLSMSLFLV